jgi:hypothetical protein
MGFLGTPNLPSDAVSLALIDCRTIASPMMGEVQSKFQERGIDIVSVGICSFLYPAICAHPDIQFHHLGENDILAAPNSNEKTVEILREKGCKIIWGESFLEARYPKDIPYNVARIGQFAFHNLRYTDRKLKIELEKRGVQMIHVEQGYSKCSILIVSSRAFITEDVGIYRAAEKHGMNVLLLKPGYVELPGLNYGLIGGAGGLISPKTLALTGRIDTHPQRDEILNFFAREGVTPLYLTERRIFDIGSILPLKDIS